MTVYLVHRDGDRVTVDHYYIGSAYPFESAYRWLRAWSPPVTTDRVTVCMYRPPGVAPPPAYTPLAAAGRPLIRNLGYYQLLTRSPFPAPLREARR